MSSWFVLQTQKNGGADVPYEQIMMLEHTEIHL